MKFLLSLILFASISHAKNPQKIRQNVLKSDVKIRKILARIYEIDKKNRRLRKNISKASEQIMPLQNQISILAKGIANLEITLNKKRKSLTKKISYLYKVDSQRALTLLFAPNISLDFLKHVRALQILSFKDQKDIQEYKKLHLSMLESRKKLYEKTSRLLKQLDREKELQKALLKQQYLQKKILRGATNRREKTLLLLEDINSSEKVAFFEHIQKLPWPIRGFLTQKFGMTTNDSHGYQLFEKGIFVSSKVGAHVNSVFGGVVKFLGKISGYGNTLIINHGYHYYSIYSHLKKALVKNGQRVNQYQTVGLAGDSSIDRGPGLYFEIRHFSDAVNPQKWLKKK